LRLTRLEADVARLKLEEYNRNDVRMFGSRASWHLDDTYRPTPRNTEASQRARALGQHPDQQGRFVAGAEVVRTYPNGKKIYRGYGRNNPSLIWSWRVWRRLPYEDGLFPQVHDEVSQRFFGAPWSYERFANSIEYRERKRVGSIEHEETIIFHGNPATPVDESHWLRGAFHNAEIKPHVAVAGSMMSADATPMRGSRPAAGSRRACARQDEFLRWE
jgi:hypothetical protein